MERVNQWIVVVLIVLLTLLISACRQAPTSTPIADPASVEEIPGSDLKRVVLTEKAAERLGIQTAMVREKQVTLRQTIVGEVLAEREGVAANSNQRWVRAQFNESDFELVARDQPAQILALSGDNQDEEDIDEGEENNGWMAEPDETFGLDDDEDNDSLDTAIYYSVDGANSNLVPGQRVLVEVALSESGKLQTTIPYAALIYEVDGGTWVYVKDSDSLSFVRESVTVDHVEGDLVYLIEGPSVDTQVVTTGAAELFGAETGVSK
jgi:hypothetical protein